MKKYRLKGKNIDELLNKAEKHFKISKNHIKYKIVKEEKGIFGKTKEVEILIWFNKKISTETNDKTQNEESESKNDDEFNETKENKSNNTESIKKIKETKENPINKYIEMQAHTEGILLKVDPDIEKLGLDNAQIFEKISKLEIKKPNIFKLREAISINIGKFVKVAEYDANYYKNATVQIEVVKKKLEAIIVVKPPDKGRHVTYDQIMNKIAKLGIKYGIDEEVIKEIVESRKYNETITFARGKPAINGADAKITYFYELSIAKKIEEDESGNVDFKNLNLINNIKIGETIAKKEHSTQGEKGIDVHGKSIIPKSGRDKRISLGRNVEFDSEERFLTATIDGQVVELNKKIHVLPIYEVRGNVDYSTGNIDFLGTVYVEGDVLEGFIVKAAGDIIINGLVEDAFLDSGASISVRKGLIGKENGKGLIMAKEDVIAKFIEHIEVEAGRDIISDELILYSNLKAERTIECEKGKGKIIGGELLAGVEIIAREVGSDYGNLCTLEVGILPKTKQKYLELKERYVEISQIEEDFSKEIKILTDMKKSGNLSKSREEGLYSKMKEMFKIRKELQDNEKATEESEEYIKRSKKGKIHVKNVITDGVLIKIGEYRLTIRDSFKYTTFYVNEIKKEIGILPCEVEE